MTGIRIAMYVAYGIFLVFAIVITVGIIWLVQQGVGTATALLATPTAIVIVITAEPPAETIATLAPIKRTPTARPTPAATATLTPDPSCIPSAQARQNLGKTVCIQGVVVKTYATQSAFFLEFDQPGTGFFGTVLDPKAALTNLVGKCVQLNGNLQEYNARAYLIFQADQLKSCPTP